MSPSAVAPARPRSPTPAPTSNAPEASPPLMSFCRFADWRKVRPLEYLAPFLEVVRSPETSGPITAVALTSIRRMLEENILGEQQLIILSALAAELSRVAVHISILVIRTRP